MLRSTAKAVRLEARGPDHRLRLRGGFGSGLALLARHGLFRVVAGGALDDTSRIQEARHAVGRLRALGEPGLDLVHVELEPRLVVLRQQRVEMAEALDEAAVAGKARIGGDDVVHRALLGARAREADDDWHSGSPVEDCMLSFRCELSSLRANGSARRAAR